MERKILVTSALPYVNNVPHLGNMICLISADVYARFLKSLGVDCLSVCGTDEHGTTSETKALEEGLTPKEVCDKYFAIHKKVYEWFECDFDCLGRTSSKANHEVTLDIFDRLYKNGYIIDDVIQQTFCEKCNKFLADRFVEGECPFCGFEDARGDQCDMCGKLLNAVELKKPRCKVCGQTPIVKETNHLFIDLPKMEPLLKAWVAKASIKGKWSVNATTMTNSWFESGLKQRCITRDLKWGIPVPVDGYKKKVFYSWFDAPIGYISITKEKRKDWDKWWKTGNKYLDSKVRLIQFMGKDNILFHTTLFPAFLIGANDNYTLLDHISSNEYLNYETGKFSKSRKTGVFGDDAKKTGIPADIWRYYLMVNRPEKTDTEFKWGDFQEKINNELVANLGNLINRTVTFTSRFYKGKAPKATLAKEDEKFIEEVRKAQESITDLFEAIKIKDALKGIMHVSKLGNSYFQENEPWKNIELDKRKADTSINLLLNLVKDLAILIEPFMPKTTLKINDMLGIKKKLQWKNLGKFEIGEGHPVIAGEILFKKLEDDDVAKFRGMFAGKREKLDVIVDKKEESLFDKMDLRVGVIKSVEDHPDAEKLYVMKVDIGREIQLVAGLKEFFKPAYLIGRKIVVVSNLEPAKLRGQVSEGMLLAADAGKEVALLAAHKSKPGDSVYIRSANKVDKKISFKEFSKIQFEVKNKNVFVELKRLHTDVEVITVDIADGAKVR